MCHFNLFKMYEVNTKYVHTVGRTITTIYPQNFSSFCKTEILSLFNNKPHPSFPQHLATSIVLFLCVNMTSLLSTSCE